MKMTARDHIVEHYSDIADVQTLSAADIGHLTIDTRHYHNCYEVVIIRKGTVNGILAYRPGQIKSGSVILIGRNLPHGIISISSNFQGTIIHIPHRTLAWDKQTHPELEKEIRFLKDSQFCYLYRSPKLAGRAAELACEMKETTGFLKMSRLFELLHILHKAKPTERLVTNAEYAASPEASLAKETPVDRAFRFLYEHFQEQITLKDVANYANQTPAALCRAFKRRCGLTIFAFVNRLKIEKACQLLQKTQFGITQVAYDAGFNTLSHFSNQFRKFMKTSPSQYRKKVNS